MEASNHLSATRILKLAISLCAYVASYVRTSLSRLAGVTPRSTCVVVYYHEVILGDRERFADQLDLLLRCARPLAIDAKTVPDTGRRHAIVTFDDAYENFYTYALPELVKRGIPATMFVITDVIGATYISEKIMSLEQIRSLPTDLVTIGSHTLTHPRLPLIDAEEAKREIVVSRKRLEEKLDRQIEFFSFPYGAFNQTLVEICREAGYRRVFSTLPQVSYQNADEFLTGRVRVDPTDWPIEFRLKLAGAYCWLPWAFELKRIIRRLLAGKKRTKPSLPVRV